MCQFKQEAGRVYPKWEGESVIDLFLLNVIKKEGLPNSPEFISDRIGLNK